MTDNRDAHTEQIAEALRTHGIYGFNGTQVACRCSQRNWRYLLDWHTHVAEALLPVVARIKADAAAEVAAAIQEVHGRYFDLDQTPSIMTDTTPEPEDVWRYDRDLRAALSTGRTALDTQLAQARAEGWDSCVEAVAWCLDNGEPSAAAALAYTHKNNPYRAEASGEGQ